MKETEQLIKELWSLWESMAECGELHIGPKFSKEYAQLKARVEQNLNIHSVSGKRPDYETILAVIEEYDSLVQFIEGKEPEHCILPEHYGQLAKDIQAACAQGALDKTVSGDDDFDPFFDEGEESKWQDKNETY